jgi:DUF1009 family protein
VARAARRRGRRICAVAFHGETGPELAPLVDELTWLHPGEVGRAVGTLLESGVREAVLAGKVGKSALLSDPGRLRPDAAARALLGRIAGRGDATILAGVASYLAERGIRLLGQAELVPDLVAGRGTLGRVRPSAAQLGDVALAWPVAKAVAELDVGQTVVARNGAVLAVEAIDGTDAAIRRAGRIAPGACVVKVARPRQDPRFDLPAVGPGTLRAMVQARAGLLACESGRTLLLERELLVAEADARGIALVGVAPEGPAAVGDAPEGPAAVGDAPEGPAAVGDARRGGA